MKYKCEGGVVNAKFSFYIIGSQQIMSESENSRNGSISLFFRNRESNTRENS